MAAGKGEPIEHDEVKPEIRRTNISSSNLSVHLRLCGTMKINNEEIKATLCEMKWKKKKTSACRYLLIQFHNWFSVRTYEKKKNKNWRAIGVVQQYDIIWCHLFVCVCSESAVYYLSIPFELRIFTLPVILLISSKPYSAVIQIKMRRRNQSQR